jgi:hypothetical protein
MICRCCALAIVAVVVCGAFARGQVRDATARATAGTSVITGTVATDDPSPRPLGRAVVTVRAAELPVPRSAITDDQGRYTVGNLPAGRYTVGATKQGYVASAYGARRMGRPGIPVMLGADQRFEANIAMTPAGVLTGVIGDELGQPLPGVRVFALDARRPVAPSPRPGSSAGSPGIGVETDDRGVYRIFNLVPGDYLVVATPTASVPGDILRPSTTEIDRVLARLGAPQPPGLASTSATAPAAVSASAETLAAVYFPGTPILSDATRVSVGRGEVRDGLNFAVRAVPVVTIEGTVIAPSGTLPQYVEMSIVPANTLRFFALASANPQLTQSPDTSGRFRYSTIVPDRYTIVARAGSLPPPGIGPGGLTVAGVPSGVMTSAETMYAVEEVEVTGQPVSGVTLRLQRGSHVSGKVVFDATTQAVPADLTGIRVTVQPLDSSSSTVLGTRIGSRLSSRQYMQLRPDGTFEFPGLAPDAYTVVCTVPAAAGSGWWLRSAMAGERDVLDTSLELRLGADVSNLVLTLTDRHSELSGMLQTPAGSPASEFFIVAMPADQALRLPGSRRIVSTRPGTDGRFRFVDLPAGEYLLVALSDLQPDELQRADFLAEIARAGVRVALSQGEKKTQDLQIAR